MNMCCCSFSLKVQTGLPGPSQPPLPSRSSVCGFKFTSTADSASASRGDTAVFWGHFWGENDEDDDVNSVIGAHYAHNSSWVQGRRPHGDDQQGRRRLRREREFADLPGWSRARSSSSTLNVNPPRGGFSGGTPSGRSSWTLAATGRASSRPSTLNVNPPRGGFSGGTPSGRSSWTSPPLSGQDGLAAEALRARKPRLPPGRGVS